MDVFYSKEVSVYGGFEGTEKEKMKEYVLIEIRMGK